MEGPTGQVDRQVGKGNDRQREDTRTDGQKGEKDGGGEGGAVEPWALTRVHPQGARVLPLGRKGPHLFQAVHVFEVEADVEQTQVRVDKLELGGRQPGSPCGPALQISQPLSHPPGLCVCIYICGFTHQDDFDDKVPLVGAL